MKNQSGFVMYKAKTTQDPHTKNTTLTPSSQ